MICKHGSPNPGVATGANQWVDDDSLPTYRFRPHVLVENIIAFQRGFPGTIAYAVKANPDPEILKILAEQGITAFDVASIGEIRRLRAFSPAAQLLYMNPVKTPASIREAYFLHGVRAFSLDAEWELGKILAQTGFARDLDLFLRVAVGDRSAKVSLSAKFGIPPADAVDLLTKIHSNAHRTGICFHVGSQCEDPSAFASAITDVAALLGQVSFAVDLLDVGGGFPAAYTKPERDISRYFEVIQNALQETGLQERLEVICEPGRALVANTESLLVRVLGRKKDTLFINDGRFGGIFEPADNFLFPVRLIRHSTAPHRQFKLFGPTCDSTDLVKMSFSLPADIMIGDSIEIGHMGAYSKTMRSGFNGFGDFTTEIVADHFPF